MTADPLPTPPTQDDLAKIEAIHNNPRRNKLYDTELSRTQVDWLIEKVQKVRAVIDSFDNADVSPTSDQSEILDALRKALRA